MENILLIFSSNNKTIEQIKLYFACKFSKLFFLNLDLNNDFSSQIKDLLEDLIHGEFMIFFDHNYPKDDLILKELENFLLEKELSPKQIILYTNKKNQNFLTSKFEYIYEIIHKPFNENLFNAKINSILKKYFILKKIKNNLNNLSVNTDYFLLSNDERKKILIIGNDKKNLKKLSKILSDKYTVQIAHFENIHQNFLKDYPCSFDLVILNDIDNIHHLIFLFNQIKAHEDLEESMIVFLIKNTDAIFLADVINLGVENYFFWPTKQIDSFLNLISFELKNKAYHDFLNLELKKALESSAIDETTKIFSKKYLMNFLEKNSQNQILKKSLGFIFLDLNNFKDVNDNYGHLAGDFVLLEIAKILTKELKNKIITRFGGDEFLILIEKINLIEPNALEKIIQELKKTITKKNFFFHGVLLKKISISTGFEIGKKGSNFLEILEIADKKLYKSKKNLES